MSVFARPFSRQSKLADHHRVSYGHESSTLFGESTLIFCRNWPLQKEHLRANRIHHHQSIAQVSFFLVNLFLFILDSRTTVTEFCALNDPQRSWVRMGQNFSNFVDYVGESYTRCWISLILAVCMDGTATALIKIGRDKSSIFTILAGFLFFFLRFVLFLILFLFHAAHLSTSLLTVSLKSLWLCNITWKNRC